MKAILKFKPLLVVLFLLTLAISSLNAADGNYSHNIHSSDNKSVTIICPNCGGYNWTLYGFWFDEETWITTSMVCDFCGYTKEL